MCCDPYDRYLHAHLETQTVLSYNLLTEQDKVLAGTRKGKLSADSQGWKQSPISVSLVCLLWSTLGLTQHLSLVSEAMWYSGTCVLAFLHTTGKTLCAQQTDKLRPMGVITWERFVFLLLLCII